MLPEVERLSGETVVGLSLLRKENTHNHLVYFDRFALRYFEQIRSFCIHKVGKETIFY